MGTTYADVHLRRAHRRRRPSEQRSPRPSRQDMACRDLCPRRASTAASCRRLPSARPKRVCRSKSRMKDARQIPRVRPGDDPQVLVEPEMLRPPAATSRPAPQLQTRQTLSQRARLGHQPVNRHGLACSSRADVSTVWFRRGATSSPSWWVLFRAPTIPGAPWRATSTSPTERRCSARPCVTRVKSVCACVCVRVCARLAFPTGGPVTTSSSGEDLTARPRFSG